MVLEIPEGLISLSSLEVWQILHGRNPQTGCIEWRINIIKLLHGMRYNIFHSTLTFGARVEPNHTAGESDVIRSQLQQPAAELKNMKLSAEVMQNHPPTHDECLNTSALLFSPKQTSSESL